MSSKRHSWGGIKVAIKWSLALDDMSHLWGMHLPNISLISWRINTVHNVSMPSSHASVHISSFSSNNVMIPICDAELSGLPLKKLDSLNGNHLVLCTICHDYVNHEKDRTGTNALNKHAGTQKRKLGLAGAYQHQSWAHSLCSSEAELDRILKDPSWFQPQPPAEPL